MFAYLNGILTDLDAENCIVEVGGIGMNVRISPTTASLLPPIGSTVKIYTYTSVREDAIQLFGFLTASDLKMFKLLISVNGIGPKGGLSILSVMDADTVRFTIITGDVNSLSKAPGVGKKSAERVILELKGKVDVNSFIQESKSSFDGMSNPMVMNDSSAMKEAAEALTALGYNSGESLKAVRNVVVSDDMSVEDILKLALKELM